MVLAQFKPIKPLLIFFTVCLFLNIAIDALYDFFSYRVNSINDIAVELSTERIRLQAELRNNSSKSEAQERKIDELSQQHKALTDRIHHLKEIKSQISFGSISIDIILLILIALWTHRSHYNTSILLQTRLSFGRPWASLGYFIPLVNLIIPILIMQDIWSRLFPEYKGKTRLVVTPTTVYLLLVCIPVVFSITGVFLSFIPDTFFQGYFKGFYYTNTITFHVIDNLQPLARCMLVLLLWKLTGRINKIYNNQRLSQGTSTDREAIPVGSQ